jgi:hypothetical protein
MSDWGREVFGEPCRECGFSWTTPATEADALIATTPERYARLLGEHDGSARHPDLEWTAGGYVCHVADSLRVWAERLASVALGDIGPVGEYDQDLLARARSYPTVGIRGALWSLGRAVSDWQAALALAVDGDVVMAHPELGEMTVLDVTRIRAHDIHHHERDVRRSLDHATS